MATIRDVARLAGVGVGTASRVISGNGSVAKATVVRVRKAIEELNFRPSHAARTLLSGSSQMIGVFIPMLRGTFYPPLLQAIDAELRACGLHMMVTFGSGDGDARKQAKEGIAFLTERGCDGLLVISNELHDEDFESLPMEPGRLVVLNRIYKSIGEQCFSADHKKGGALAANSLLKMKHRKFAVIGGPVNASDNVNRLKGFMQELSRNGIKASQVTTLVSDFSTGGGWDSAKELVESGAEFSALFCANDEMAIGALSYFQHVGVKVPQEISVMGYDDTHSAEFSGPKLTSVHIPWHEITLNGLHWLLNQCYGSEHVVQRVFPASITWRASVTPLTTS